MPPRPACEALTLAASNAKVTHPLVNEVENPQRAAIVLITADRGLAGAYSSNAIKEARRFAKRLRDRGLTLVNWASSVAKVSASTSSVSAQLRRPGWDSATTRSTTTRRRSQRDCCTTSWNFPKGRVDEIHIVYAFVNRVVQEARVIRVVPVGSCR